MIKSNSKTPHIGAPLKNQNARKHGHDTTLTIRCNKRDLKRWAKLAASAGISRTAWIIARLNGCG